jgi:hypothetical protein
VGGGGERRDEYLDDPTQKELGIKRRGGAKGVEVKGLVAVLSEDGGEPPFRGRIELWSKWTSTVLDLSGHPMTATTKKRWLRRFDLSVAIPKEIPLGAGKTREEPLHGERVDRGCNVEITELLVADGKAWWTLGFEAFGDRTTIEGDLLTVIGVMARRHPPPFDTTCSASYPAWLSGLRRSRAPDVPD